MSGEKVGTAERHLILVVEDDFMVSRLLEGQLGPYYDVEVCSTAADAFCRLLHQPRPDVLIVDPGLRCPGWYGIRTVKGFVTVVVEEHPIPVIVLSGGGLTRQQVVDEAGAFEYFVKPVEVEAFRRSIAAAIGKAASMMVKDTKKEVCASRSLLTGLSAVTRDATEQCNERRGRKQAPPSTVTTRAAETQVLPATGQDTARS